MMVQYGRDFSFSSSSTRRLQLSGGLKQYERIATRPQVYHSKPCSSLSVWWMLLNLCKNVHNDCAKIGQLSRKTHRPTLPPRAQVFVEFGEIHMSWFDFGWNLAWLFWNQTIWHIQALFLAHLTCRASPNAKFQDALQVVQLNSCIKKDPDWSCSWVMTLWSDSHSPPA